LFVVFKCFNPLIYINPDNQILLNHLNPDNPDKKFAAKIKKSSDFKI